MKGTGTISGDKNVSIENILKILILPFYRYVLAMTLRLLQALKSNGTGEVKKKIWVRYSIVW